MHSQFPSTTDLSVICQVWLNIDLETRIGSCLPDKSEHHLSNIKYAVEASIGSGRFARRWCPQNGYQSVTHESLEAYIGQVIKLYFEDGPQVAALKSEDGGAWCRLRTQVLAQCTAHLATRGLQGAALLDHAEALTQESLLHIWQDLDSYCFDVPFEARWRTIVANTLNAFWRQYRDHLHRQLPEEDWHELHDPKATRELEQVELQARLKEAIAQLPTHAQRQAMLLDLQGDLSTTAIAQRLGVSTQAVYNLRNRARERLRTLLEEPRS